MLKMERHIDIDRFDYDLPDERIAKYPLEERSASKLLVYERGEISERRFRDIGDILPEGTLLVFNNTKVIRARIIMHKPSGARIEVFCLEPHDPADYERAFAVKGSCRWSCIVGNLKKWKEGPLVIDFEYEGRAERMLAWREGEGGREQIVRFEWTADLTFGQLLEHLGTGEAYDSVAQAWRAALADAKPEDTVLVCGSFHTVAHVMEVIDVGRSGGE